MPHEFEAQDGDVRTTGFPAITRANGTNIPVAGYAFDAATEEALFFRFKASDYVSGNIVVELDWYADTATSGNVVWGAQLAAITPDTDTQDIETDGLPTVTTVTDAAGASSQRAMRATITLTGAALDSVAPNDLCVLRVSRVAANGSDTMAGDAILTYVSIGA
jgi:hypothetical protein